MKIPVIRCENCNTAIDLSGNEASCVCGKTHFSLSDGIYVSHDLSVDQNSEMLVRDRQADGYLLHNKFPTQIASFDRWLNGIGTSEQSNPQGALEPGGDKIALDLGCGPGPWTKKLQESGYLVIAIDFSVSSLKVNSDNCKDGKTTPIFLQEDLNKISFVKNSVDLVVMADFLQHLGGRSQRERLLQEVFGALKMNGRFYLSFFNLNIKNYLKGDVHGGFAGGMIRYERLTTKNVIAGFPKYIVIDSVRPMNIVHGAMFDKILTTMPLSRFFSRMVMVTGKKYRVFHSMLNNA